ncbi:hypothetical protein [uncultured Mediterranean phage uvMED]|nr:hypothetical protein [uncultured Mediterranean phage uvMED]BAQ86061.1 hypothetical protein [uncultured Mediterranean phage uvMED]
MSKAGNQYSVGRKQAKSLLTQKASASVPLGGMNWGNILMRGGLKMLGVIGATLSPKTAGAPSVKDWKGQFQNYKKARAGAGLFELAEHEDKVDRHHGFDKY